MGWIEPITLAGRHVTLVPLEIAHGPALVEAASDGELWRIWYTSVPEPDGMDAEIRRRLALQDAGIMLPFAVLDADGVPVGMSCYGNIDATVRRVEIGWTWYARRVQRSALNSEAKRRLLSHAFETLGCVAVEFRTHFLNQQSRRAIDRLGAKLDGVLRQHMLARDGTLRDTCVYSIVAAEWPAVRSGLEWEMARPR